MRGHLILETTEVCFIAAKHIECGAFELGLLYNFEYATSDDTYISLYRLFASNFIGSFTTAEFREDAAMDFLARENIRDDELRFDYGAGATRAKPSATLLND